MTSVLSNFPSPLKSAGYCTGRTTILNHLIGINPNGLESSSRIYSDIFLIFIRAAIRPHERLRCRPNAACKLCDRFMHALWGRMTIQTAGKSCLSKMG